MLKVEEVPTRMAPVCQSMIGCWVMMREIFGWARYQGVKRCQGVKWLQSVGGLGISSTRIGVMRVVIEASSMLAYAG